MASDGAKVSVTQSLVHANSLRLPTLVKFYSTTPTTPTTPTSHLEAARESVPISAAVRGDERVKVREAGGDWYEDLRWVDAL